MGSGYRSCNYGAITHGLGRLKFSQSKIEDLDRPFIGDHDVCRLNVPVHDLRSMCGGQSCCNLTCVIHGAIHGQRTMVQQLRQRLARGEFHDDAVGSAHRFQSVNLYNVWVVQRGSCLRFLQEPEPVLFISMSAIAQYFDGNETFQPGVPGLIHFAHATLSKLFEDTVRADFCAGQANSRTDINRIDSNMMALVVSSITFSTKSPSYFIRKVVDTIL